MSPADPDTLLAAYGRTGNPRDLAALFDATAPELFRVALATAPDAASAEDALQETFLTVMDAAPKFDATRRALPWLVGILKFKVAALRSRRFRSRGDEDTPPPTLADAPTDGEADPDEIARVRAEIEHLSEPYRSVALLRWRYGLTPAEIAHVRGEPPGTVRSILSRSLDRLRRGLRAVPAFFFGTRAERGLDGVRAHLLATAAAKSGAVAHVAARTAARAWIAGSLAAGLLLTGAVILWNSGGGGGAPPPAGSPTPPVLAADAAEKGNPPGLAGAGGNPRGMLGAAGAVRIRGLALDGERKPLRGVHVAALEESANDEEFVDFASLLPTGTSTPDGAFSVETPYHAARLVAWTDDGRLGIAAEARPGIDSEVVLRAPRTLRGRVVDEMGKPVEGATVVAYTIFDRVAHKSTSASASSVDGSFALTVPGRTNGDEIETAGSAFVWATAPGRSPSMRQVALEPGAPGEAMLELGPAAHLSVSVIDGTTGAPIAGARVAVVADHGFRVFGAFLREQEAALLTLASATAGADGLALLGDLPVPTADPSVGSGLRRSSLRIVIAADGYATVGRLLLPAVDRTEPFVVKLLPPATVVGRLTRAQGDPVAGVSLMLGVGTWSSKTEPFIGLHVAISGADGSFRLEGIAPRPPFSGEWRLQALPRDRIDGFLRDLPVLLAPGETCDLGALVLPEGLRNVYRVVVVDAEGAPLAAARVSVPMDSSGRTDSSGLVELLVSPPRADVNPALRRIDVAALGYVRATSPLPPAPPTSPLRIVLERGGVVRGRVLEVDGTPADRCDLTVYESGTDEAAAPSGLAAEMGSESIGRAGEGDATFALGGEGSLWLAPGTHTKTDEAGWFRLDGIGYRPVDLVASRTVRRAPAAVERVRAVARSVRAGAGDLELRLAPVVGPEPAPAPTK